MHEQNLNTVIRLFCLSIASIRSKSLKSEGLIGLEIDVISIPRLLEAALILESARFPFNNNRNNKSGRKIRCVCNCCAFTEYFKSTAAKIFSKHPRLLSS